MTKLEELLPVTIQDISKMDTEMKDRWACSVITCRICPHKFDFPKCRTGLFEEMIREKGEEK
jgi:hypothetical protein